MMGEVSVFPSVKKNGVITKKQLNFSYISARKLALHLCQSDAAIRWCWQERVKNGQKSSCWSRATEEWEDWSQHQIRRCGNARLHTANVAMNSLQACPILRWPVWSPDLSLIQHIWDRMRRWLQLFWNIDDLVQQLENNWHEILQDTIQ